MTYSFGKIKTNLIKSYKDLNYTNKPYNDLETYNKWVEIGHRYEKYTGLMIDQSQPIPKWCFDVCNTLPLKKTTCTLYCMTPGTILPTHIDTFSKYKQVFDLNLSTVVSRIVVFLEDWQSGHYFEIDKKPVVKWEKGDYVLWEGNIPHMAANIGSTNRYTLQITGIKNV